MNCSPIYNAKKLCSSCPTIFCILRMYVKVVFYSGMQVQATGLIVITTINN